MRSGGSPNATAPWAEVLIALTRMVPGGRRGAVNRKSVRPRALASVDPSLILFGIGGTVLLVVDM